MFHIRSPFLFQTLTMQTKVRNHLLNFVFIKLIFIKFMKHIKIKLILNNLNNKYQFTYPNIKNYFEKNRTIIKVKKKILFLYDKRNKNP